MVDAFLQPALVVPEETNQEVLLCRVMLRVAALVEGVAQARHLKWIGQMEWHSKC